MKTIKQSIALRIWIAEHGDSKAKELLCREVGINNVTLYRILRGTIPRFENRYRIYKLTGIKLLEDDDFPERQEAG